MSWNGLERRMYVRHQARALVRITGLPGRAKHEAARADLVNMSVGGCAVRLREPVPNLRMNTRLHVIIVVTVGGVAKPHHRFGAVRHITHGLIGLHTDVWTAQTEREVESWLKQK